MGHFAVVEIDGVPATRSGQLPVIVMPPEPPPGTEPVDRAQRVGEGEVSKNTPQEVSFSIPTGKKLTVISLVGGAESSIAGCRVDLLHQDGTEQRITAPLFLNGTTNQVFLSRVLTAGTVVLRRTNVSGSPVFIYAEWDGFLEDA